MSGNQTSKGTMVGGVTGGMVAGVVIGYMAAGALDAPAGPQPLDYYCLCDAASGGDPEKAKPMIIMGPLGTCPHQDKRNHMGCNPF